MINKYKKHFKNNPEALKFIKENPELFKDIAHGPALKQPEEKLVFCFEDTYLVGPKQRAILQDVLAGLSNEEIKNKYGYETTDRVARVVYKAKETLKKQTLTGKYLLKNKSQVPFTEFIDKRVFTYRGKTEEVFLIKVRSKYILSYQIFDDDHINALVYKAKLLESQMPALVRRQWRHLTGKLIFADKLKDRETLLHFLNHYRWVDKDGTLFKPSVDILLSNLNSSELDQIEEQ